MLIRAFTTHKKAEYFSDCQDRFSINPDTKSIALSDGMSQSIFQKYWAEILVNTYTSQFDWFPNLAAVRELSPLWTKKVEEFIENQKREGNPIWRVERSLTDGCSAGATFLGIRFEGSEWKCEVLGDSCLVLIQNSKIKDIISSEESDSFSNYPDYYDSNPKKDGKGQLREESGKLDAGEVILLVSDPFSDFLLRKKESKEEKNLIECLMAVHSHEKFEELVGKWRGQGMHNDDSTLIIVESDGSDEFHIEIEDDIVQLINKKTSKLDLTCIEVTDAEDQVKVNIINEMSVKRDVNKKKIIDVNISGVENENSSTLDLVKIFDREFVYSLEVSIYANLKGLMLLKNQKKERAKTIAAEIMTLLHHTLKKK